MKRIHSFKKNRNVRWLIELVVLLYAAQLPTVLLISINALMKFNTNIECVKAKKKKRPVLLNAKKQRKFLKKKKNFFFQRKRKVIFAHRSIYQLQGIINDT